MAVTPRPGFLRDAFQRLASLSKGRTFFPVLNCNLKNLDVNLLQSSSFDKTYSINVISSKIDAPQHFQGKNKF